MTRTSLMIEKSIFLAYSTFKTFDFKVYFNSIVVEFWLVVLFGWTKISWNTVFRYGTVFSHSKPILNFQMVKQFLVCVSCSSSTSCYFECVCNFVLSDCSRFVKRIKVVSHFVLLFLPVEIIRVIWYFVVCSELCSIVLEIQISIRKKYVLNMGRYFPVEIISANLSFVFLFSIPGCLIF